MTTNKCPRGTRLAGWFAGALLVCGLLQTAAWAAKPIPIGVMAPEKLADGRAIMHAAQLAVDQINAAGGVNGRNLKLYKFDDKASGANAVRALKRAVDEDHVKAMVGVFISEVALAVEPWAGRLHTPFIITGSLSTKVAQNIHDHYNRDKYVFQAQENSKFVAESICHELHALVVKKLHYSRAVILHEQAAFALPMANEYRRCLPRAGLKVVDEIAFSRSENDFTPIFDQVEKDHAQVAVTAVGINGTRPVVQWHQQQAPFLLAGQDADATDPHFWRDTNGAAQGVLEHTFGAGVALTSKSVSFYRAYKARFHEAPADLGYPAYDGVYILKAAIERAGSVQPDALVKALEKTNMDGVTGHIAFYGRHSRYTHGKKYQRGVLFQWQHGKQVVLLPGKVSQGHLKVPAFVRPHGN
ncbi:MAG TPA: ABC transporter substrate-binding protein [Gammaproteobacteria bacterium]|nr:ABC transporter substrate-binding protein [Gammaproteobacteria bacterium]